MVTAQLDWNEVKTSEYQYSSPGVEYTTTWVWGLVPAHRSEVPPPPLPAPTGPALPAPAGPAPPAPPAPTGPAPPALLAPVPLPLTAPLRAPWREPVALGWARPPQATATRLTSAVPTTARRAAPRRPGLGPLVNAWCRPRCRRSPRRGAADQRRGSSDGDDAAGQGRLGASHPVGEARSEVDDERAGAARAYTLDVVHHVTVR